MRRLSVRSESGSDVTEAPPEATLVEIMEVEVPVELGRSLVDGVDDQRLKRWAGAVCRIRTLGTPPC